MDNVSDETEVRVILARLEGKLDANLAAHGGDIANLKAQNLDQEARLRHVESEVSRVDSKPTVSPKQLWVGFTGAVAAATGVVVLFQNLFPHAQ